MIQRLRATFPLQTRLWSIPRMRSAWASSPGPPSKLYPLCSEARGARRKADCRRSRKNQLSYLLDIGVDGVITDYPESFLHTLKRKGYEVPPRGDADRIEGCLAKHAQYTSAGLTSAGY